MPNEFSKFNEGGVDHAFLFTSIPESERKDACDHEDCIKMRKNFLLLPEYGDDERVKALSVSEHFAKLTIVTMLLATLTGKSPADAALIIAEAGRLSLTPLIDKADVTDEEILKATTDDTLIQQLSDSPSWTHDAGSFIQVSMQAGANPVTIGVGVMVLAYALEDGKYISYTPKDAAAGSGTVDKAVLTGEDILDLAGIAADLNDDEDDE